MMKWRIVPYCTPMMEDYELYIGAERLDGTLLRMTADMETRERGSQHPPTLGYSVDVRGFLKAAMDAAWEIGIRPTQLPDVRGELTATKYHLEDMRKMAIRNEQ